MPRRVAANALSLLLAYLLPRGLTFIALLIAARVLGTESFGAFGTAASLAVIVSILSSLGMMPLLIREIARSPDWAPTLLRSAHFIKTCANILMLVTLAGVANWVLRYPPPILVAALLFGLAHTLHAYAETFSAYFQAVERMHVWTQASTAGGVVAAIAAMAVLAVRPDLLWFCASFVAGNAAMLVWLWWRAPITIRAIRPVRRRDVMDLLRALRPFFFSALVVAAYYKIDILLLTGLRAAAESGLYTAARKFIDVGQALILVAIGAVYPRLARVGTEQTAAASRLLNVAWLAAVPIAALLFLLRDQVVVLAYGDAYRGSARPLGLLALGIPALTINMLGSYLLAVGQRMSTVAALYGAGLVMNVALNAMLIPPLGRTGTAIAFLTSEFLVAAGFLAALAGALRGRLDGRAVVAAAGTVVILAVAEFGTQGAPPLHVVALSAVAIGAWYGAAGVFRSPHFQAVIDACRTIVGLNTASRAGGA